MPVSDAIRAARQRRYDRRREHAATIVPEGPYCYKRQSDNARNIKLCPFWKARSDWPDQAYAFCRLLKVGDATPERRRNGEVIAQPTWLLWDQVKECDVNPGNDNID